MHYHLQAYKAGRGEFGIKGDRAQALCQHREALDNRQSDAPLWIARHGDNLGHEDAGHLVHANHLLHNVKL